MLAGGAADDARRGGVALAAALAAALGPARAAAALPLVLPLMGHMGDPLPGVRAAATAAFAPAVALVPLAQARPTPHSCWGARRLQSNGTISTT
jgi:hypothetical protein